MTRLPQTDWLDAAPTQRVIGALEAEREASARFVGGCVRNAMLNEPAGDIDIATQLTPDVVERVLKAAGCAVHHTGLEHGTLTAVCQHQPFEITTLRRDVETDGRRAVIAFTEDWTEDASRRDFTINALYADANGEVLDPTGQGLSDISARRVVFVGDAGLEMEQAGCKKPQLSMPFPAGAHPKRCCRSAPPRSAPAPGGWCRALLRLARPHHEAPRRHDH